MQTLRGAEPEQQRQAWGWGSSSLSLSLQEPSGLDTSRWHGPASTQTQHLRQDGGLGFMEGSSPRPCAGAVRLGAKAQHTGCGGRGRGAEEADLRKSHAHVTLPWGCQFSKHTGPATHPSTLKFSRTLDTGHHLPQLPQSPVCYLLSPGDSDRSEEGREYGLGGISVFPKLRF